MSKSLKEFDTEVALALANELTRQQEQLEMIASENYVSEAVLEAQGSVLTNKYAEGYPAKRYYNGCEYVDVAEQIAIDRAKEIFKAEHVNVQPHCGSSANMACYMALLNPGDKILTLSLDMGGHLTHGSKVNFSGRLYEIAHYPLSKETGCIDMIELARIAEEFKPKLIVAGASAYPRTLDFEGFAKIAANNNALLMADIAHIAGLVAAGLHPSPFPHCDVVTTTTHKTLRGPRGGMIMCKEKYAKKINSRIFPGIQGGPLMHVIAAKAVAFKEALAPEFKDYQKAVIENAHTLAEELKSRGFNIITGGTDNHMILVDVKSSRDITGAVAADLLDEVGITVNKNLIPYDELSPKHTSGIRIGTPALTTRGMGAPEMLKIAEIIDKSLSNSEDKELHKELRAVALSLSAKFPIY